MTLSEMKGTKKYQIIYADPPWQFSSKQYQDGGRDFDRLGRHYATMGMYDIKSLSIRNISSENSACFLWVVDSFLKQGIEVLESWGFDYKTVVFNWIKQYNTGEFCFNFAPYTLKSWELCLLGIRGTMGKYKVANNIKGLLFDVRTEHSKKPDVIRNRIVELFGDLPRIELFARQKTEGWDCWGDEVESDISLGS